VYLAKLVSASFTDRDGRTIPSHQSYIVFVVRDDQGRHALLFQCAATTYQAYNSWGGQSLYGGPQGYADRSRAVSFDRPYDGFGAGHFLYWEYPMVRWLERHGYDLAYSTSIDTHGRPNSVLQHSGFLSVGHDEYWSAEMRTAVEQARDAGVSLGFFGGNPMYWQIRMEPSESGGPERVIVCYKQPDEGIIDPMNGVDDAHVTSRWRDPPVPRPEQWVVGQMYGDWFWWERAPYQAALVLRNTDAWPFIGTDLDDNARIPGLIGGEFDQVHDNVAERPDLVRLSQSEVVFRGFPGTANTTIYQAPSGARVFSAGSIFWSWGLDNFDPGGELLLQDPLAGPHYVANPSLQRLTSNILNSFLGPAMLADFAAAKPPADVHYVAERRTSMLAGWIDPDDVQLAGDFMGLGRDQLFS
jgi:hypothetical protein